MYGLHVCGGYALNQFAAGCCYASALGGIVFLAARRCGNWTLAACSGILAFGVLSTNLGVRPQSYSAVLFVLELAALLHVRNTLVAAMSCLAIEALWTNIHGAFPLGVILPALMLVSDSIERTGIRPISRLRHRLAAVTGATIGCFLRPSPLTVFGYVHNVSSRSVQRGLEEWLPTSWGTAGGMMFFASVLLVIVVLGWSRRRTSIMEQLFLAAFFGLAITSQRMLLWWALILPLVIARPADHVWRSVVKSTWWRGRTAHGDHASWDWWVSFIAGGLAAAFLTLSTPWTRSANPLLPPVKRCAVPLTEPRSLVRHMPELTGFLRTYSPLSWGSYLTWHSHGQLKSFLDSRVDFFPDDVWNAFVAIRHGGIRALDLLDQYHIDVVVCGPQEAELKKLLSHHAGWKMTYEDDLSCMFRRLGDELMAPEARCGDTCQSRDS